MSNADKHLKCSFCGKGKDVVPKFISGPSVYICNECVVLCNEILIEDGFLESGLLGSITMNDIEKVSQNQSLDLKKFVGELAKGKPKTLLGLVQRVFRLVAIETAKGLGKEHLKLVREDQRLLKTLQRIEARAAGLRQRMSENADKRRQLKSRAPSPKK